MSQETGDRVPPYNDAEKEKRRLDDLATYEYEHVFNYPNVEIEREVLGGEQHGTELMPVPEVGRSHRPADRIRIEEPHPITRVTVVGSACTPPGWVRVEAEPTDDFYRKKEKRRAERNQAVPLRFHEGDLWGMHIRGDAKDDPHNLENGNLPLAGMSSARFDLPRSESVEIFSGSQAPGWSDDSYPDDQHYSIKVIRVTVDESETL